MKLLIILLLSISLFAIEELEPIEVITKQNSLYETTHKRVITKEEIEHYTTLLEVLQREASFSIVSAGGVGQQSSIFLRGGGGKSILVLIDGIRLNDPTTTNNQALLESISTQTIEKIEIIEGVMGALFGANGSSGVISITTKKPKKGVLGAISLGYGSYHTRVFNSTLSFSAKDISILYDNSLTKSQGFSAIVPKESEEDGYFNRTHNIKLNYNPFEYHKFSIGLYSIDTNTEFDSSFPLPNPNDKDSTSTTHQRNYFFSYLFSKDKHKLNLITNRTQIKRSYPYSDYKISSNNYKLNYSYRDKSLLSSLIISRDEFKSKNPYAINSFTTALSYKLNKILLESAISYNSITSFKNKTTYRVGSSYLLSNFNLGVNYATSYNAPSNYQLSNSLNNLLPEYIKGFETFIKYKDILAIYYFKNDTKDFIGYLYDVNSGIGGYYNSGNENYRGLRANFNYNFNNYLFKTDYSHLFTYKTNQAKNLDKRAKDKVTMSLEKITSNNRYGVKGTYIGKREEFLNSTGEYALFDIYTNLLLEKSLKLNISLRNIFDRDYINSYGYSSAGREFLVTLKYNF